MRTLHPGQRVILENTTYNTRVEGTLHSTSKFSTVHTIRQDNGKLYRTEGKLTPIPIQETTPKKQTLLQRIKTFFTR